jgi:hypothetical protein
LERLEVDNARLQARLDELEGRRDLPADDNMPPGGVTRRQLLRRLGTTPVAGATAAVGVSALAAQPVQAEHTPLFLNHSNSEPLQQGRRELEAARLVGRAT